MTTHRITSEKQLAALVKARSALVKKHTCERCGWEDPARGLKSRSENGIYNTMRDGVIHRYCISCRLYFRWLDTRQGIEERLHGLFEQHMPLLFLDTETTGTPLHRNSQIVEVGIIDQHGNVVYHSLCKPNISMPAEASEVNGLTDDLLTDAPTFTHIWPTLVQVLTTTDTPIYTWNADFDREMLLQTAKRFGLSVPPSISKKERWHCAMKLHARWYGEWSNGKNDYRWQPLAWACTELGVETDTLHRAIGDAENTLRVLRAIADRAWKFPPPEDMPYHDRGYES